MGLGRRRVLALGAATLLDAAVRADDIWDVRAFGAAGDGVAHDTAAVNRAIAAAASAGGGVVRVPPGTYACHSIRLQSHITLVLAPGATLLAAEAAAGVKNEAYDPPEADAPWARYQDFGHNHWHNSLIWGEGLRDVTILGPGVIWGKGLSRGLVGEAGLPPANAPGAADKAIALKSCRNVRLRDLAIRAGGHIAILATGVDNLTLDNLTIDTNRDGINIDCCRNVRIAGCRVNSPWDDAICLKSSDALGEVRATENVTISDCYVTGLYRLGTMLDGSRQSLARGIEDNGGQPTGRIKCGTESVGGFRNIAVSNCVFEGCRGLALECVDGGVTEDIVVNGLTMRDIRDTPFFLRLGARLRAPAGRAVGVLRRVIVSNVVCDAPAATLPGIISGIPDHPVEDVLLSDIYFVQKGGASAMAAEITPPEAERDYPEPARFGPCPAQGLFIRHAKNVVIRTVALAAEAADARPFVWLSDVMGVSVSGLHLRRDAAAPAFLLDRVRDIRITASSRVADRALAAVTHQMLP